MRPWGSRGLIQPSSLAEAARGLGRVWVNGLVDKVLKGTPFILFLEGARRILTRLPGGLEIPTCEFRQSCPICSLGCEAALVGDWFKVYFECKEGVGEGCRRGTSCHILKRTCPFYLETDRLESRVSRMVEVGEISGLPKLYLKRLLMLYVDFIAAHYAKRREIGW